MHFFSNIISTSGFGEANSQASNLALIFYCHLSINPSQYLIPSRGPCIRITPLPPSSSVCWDNKEEETAPWTANSI